MAEPESSKDQELQINDPSTLLSLFAAVFDCARAMATPDAHRNWRSACGAIVWAARRAEELLQPWLLVEVVPEESDVFTHLTARSHPRAPIEDGVTVTALTWSVTDETWTQDAEAFHFPDFPDAIAAGETEAKLQSLEHQLLELQNTYKSQKDPEIALTLHALGNVSLRVGDLEQAKQHFDESLRMKRSLYGGMDHPDIARDTACTRQCVCAGWRSQASQANL